MCTDILAGYFQGKLDALRESIGAHDSSGSEDEEAEAMDTSDSPKAGTQVMGAAWLQRLQQVVSYMEQLELGVSISHPPPSLPPVPLPP